MGAGCPVATVGVLNVSPESFYGPSVHTDTDALLRVAHGMVRAGAAILDVGAMSTAPYLPARISEAEERDRLGEAVHRLREQLDVTISADTSRSGPARAALEAGATVVNDVTGLRGDAELAPLLASRGAGVIIVARPGAREAGHGGGTPLEAVARALEGSLEIARGAGVGEKRIAVDPGIGFFRDAGIPWYEWDSLVLARLGDLLALGRPLCVGVSRKSFIGALTGRDRAADRLAGSVAATAVAVLNGAALVRTHDVAETRDAIAVASALRR